MSKAELEDLSWVIRGKQRRTIIQHIKVKEAATPTHIAKTSNYSLNATSRILSEFRERGLAKCLNPKSKTGRLYVLTPRGKIIRDKLLKLKRSS
ncbi:MAG: hypothetical protein ACE5FT_07300 [Candidatus Nanoarchaeia archaeon]